MKRKHQKRDKNKPNPQKGPGIVDKVKKTKSKEQVEKLVTEAKEYESIAASTLRKVEKIAKRKIQQFK